MAVGDKIYIADKPTLDEIKMGLLGSSFLVSKAAAHQAQTTLDITGKGILQAIFISGSAINNFSIQIDGGEIFGSGSSAPSVVPLAIPFNSKLKVTSNNSASLAVVYKLR